MMDKERKLVYDPATQQFSVADGPVPEGSMFVQPMPDEPDDAKKSMADMHRVTVEQFRRQKKMPVAVVLDNIRSLNNIGSVFRTCDGFACATIALCGITATPPSPQIHKTALGAEESMHWRYYPTTLEAVEALRSQGYTVLCLEQVHGSVPLQKLSPKPGQPYAIVVGNEVDGVDPEVVRACDGYVEIPQSGTKHSLNVAVATAVTLWEFYKVSDVIGEV